MGQTLGRTARAGLAAGVALAWPGIAVAQDAIRETGGTGERPLIGVKIYEPVPDTDALFREWSRLGIDTAFISTGLAESGSFIPAARRAGIRTLVITPVFFNPEYLAGHPEAWAINGRGERAKQDWVEFVCPSREDYRRERARRALSLLEKERPDGLSLDFIRHFVFWEMVGPDASIDPLDTTCFCSHCLARFQKETGIRLPEEAAVSPTAAAERLFDEYADAWLEWRAGLITTWVRELVREARRIAPDVVAGVHLVPWGSGDYENGLLRVAGQDVEALAPLVDYVSPMCYAHMLHRVPAWVGEVAEHIARRVDVPVVPSIEVRESYRSEELTSAFFDAALDAALRPPSDGVVFWSWPPLAESEARRKILAGRAR